MFKGRWSNELGSILEINTVNSDGTFTGKYITAVGDDDARGKEEPLIGRYHGELISFIVDFYDDSGSMTSWMGRYEHVSDPAQGIDEERIHTIWTLARTVSGPLNDAVQIWETFLTNANQFVKL